MSKRCQPGVICIENVTIVIIIIILCGISLIIHFRNNSGTGRSDIIREKIVFREPNGMGPNGMDRVDRFSEDVLLNPYDAPLRDDRYIQNRGGLIPINIPTQSIDTNYRQVGILTRIKGKETILPLMGRPLFTNRDKWNFYTMNDSNIMIKLPITYKGRSCTSEYGCDNLYNGDIVYVEGFNDAFKVTAYDNQTMRYIPFI
jgi:hypothetical protein